MKTRLLILLASCLTLGSAALLAQAACCASPVRGNPETAAVDPVRLMLGAYEDMSDALANDDLEAAQAAGRRLAGGQKVTGTTLPCLQLEENCCAEEGEGCRKSLRAILETDDIEVARRHFKVISAQAIRLVEGRDGFYVMHCPMAGKNADWVQSDPEIRNPYHGSRMLRCGVIRSGG